MLNVYDKLKDFAMILGDFDKDEEEKYLNLMRGVVIDGTNDVNQPEYNKIPYLLRSMIYVDPDTSVSKHGSFSMALPAIVEKEGNTLLVRVLNEGGKPEPKLKGVENWQLPEGGQAGIAEGQGGVLVAGTETGSNKKIFVPSFRGLIAAHRNKDATTGSSFVSDLTEDGKTGLQALLSKAFWVTQTPTQVDSRRRNAVAINAYSEGDRRGKGVEHQGGAIILFNSNIRSSVGGGEPPKVTAWSAWGDDGPYFEGEGTRDHHLKGVDADGTPHLPLMFHKERTKFGPGPKRKPSAPFDFLDSFAKKPKKSNVVYRGEIKYDKTLFHSNNSGINSDVQGRWVIEYRLPFRTPEEEDDFEFGTTVNDSQTKFGDTQTKVDAQFKDIQTKTPEERLDIQQKFDDDPPTIVNDSQVKDPGIKEQLPDFPSDNVRGPGPGDSGGGPGTCGHPGQGESEPGTGGGSSDGVGRETGDPDATGDAQGKQDSALKKRKSAADDTNNSITSNVQHPVAQTNINSVLLSGTPTPNDNSLRRPMFTHLQSAYPSLMGVLPTLETGRLTQVGVPSSAEDRDINNWDFSSTQIAAFGNIDRPSQKLRIDKDRKTVLGGMIVAGSNLTPPQIYDSSVDGLEAVLAIRPEASIKFGYPATDGVMTVKTDSQGFDHSVGEIKALFDRLLILKHNGLITDIQYNHLVEISNTVLLTPQTTAQRPAIPLEGMFRYNSTLTGLEYYNGTEWVFILDNANKFQLRVVVDTDLADHGNLSNIITVFVNTDGGNVTVTLPGASDSLEIQYIIKNTGTSGNQAFVAPKAGDTLQGITDSFALNDAEDLDVEPNTTDGWY